MRSWTGILCTNAKILIREADTAMKMKYYKDTDSLYIDLSSKSSIESREVSPGIVLDLDKENQVVGIDFDHASKILNFSELEISNIPSAKFIFLPVQGAKVNE